MAVQEFSPRSQHHQVAQPLPICLSLKRQVLPQSPKGRDLVETPPFPPAPPSAFLRSTNLRSAQSGPFSLKTTTCPQQSVPLTGSNKSSCCKQVWGGGGKSTAEALLLPPWPCKLEIRQLQSDSQKQRYLFAPLQHISNTPNPNHCFSARTQDGLHELVYPQQPILGEGNVKLKTISLHGRKYFSLGYSLWCLTSSMPFPLQEMPSVCLPQDLPFLLG